ncbi:hypothetical protein N7523_003267 [Penicillium sp. IBT 18751x]|nr:hypothetical protein N7523_003267 [Penicillium sp. IBT 18751x]
MRFINLYTVALLVVASAAQKTREVVVNASQRMGALKNLQGTNSADTSRVMPSEWAQDTIYNKDPAIGALFPEYGIKHVLIYTFPEVFMGFGKTGADADPSINANYNWTYADLYVNYVFGNGAKVWTNSDIIRTWTDLLLILPARHPFNLRNGANGSGFSKAIELIEFLPETDLLRTSAQNYDEYFEYFAKFSRAVASASSDVKVSAWGGNQLYPATKNYSVYDPYSSKFYKDCRDQNVPIKAASFHLTSCQFSFDPYDIKRVVDKFRTNVLIPAGLPDLAVWATEYEPAPFAALPTSPGALQSFNDPAFFASFNLGVSMYAQDTSVEQVMPWPGFGYNGTGAGNQPFHGFFNRSAGGPVSLNAAKAFLLQANLVSESPNRVKVQGSSDDGFAVLAGISTDNTKLQVLLNNYQLNYDIATEITTQIATIVNTSAAAYPLLQKNGRKKLHEAYKDR